MYPHVYKNKHKSKKFDPSGFLSLVVLLFGAFILLFVIIFVFKIIARYHSSAIPEVKSGIAGYCLDVHRDSLDSNADVDSWSCNGTAAQDWTVSSDTIRHNKNYCLSIQNNGTSSGDKIVSDTCNGSASQVWTTSIDGFENPASALCLDVPNSKTDTQLILGSCNGLTGPNEAWATSVWSKDNTSGASTSCSGSEGQLIACYAAEQWAIWQSGATSHSTLLNNYSDGNGYEEWCADFVSYVYKESGHPFSYGERNGWDEYLADNIQNMGFTYHPANGYIPQAGDVAYFDYPGGHVEIVAVGGSKPIFIYGDSGATDPSTGNGDMAEDTITNYPSEGQLEYYLSPN